MKSTSNENYLTKTTLTLARNKTLLGLSLVHTCETSTNVSASIGTRKARLATYAYAVRVASVKKQDGGRIFGCRYYAAVAVATSTDDSKTKVIEDVCRWRVFFSRRTLQGDCHVLVQ